MDMSAFTRQFVDEARERLQSLNDALLRLEDAPGSAEILADVFREAHSLKGSAQMLGFVDIDLHIPPRIDNRRGVRRFVANQVRRLGEAVQIELLEDHECAPAGAL